jgi:hypothetical protein
LAKNTFELAVADADWHIAQRQLPHSRQMSWLPQLPRTVVAISYSCPILQQSVLDTNY